MSDQLMKTALSLHQAGKLAEASELYAAVLKLQPKHFDALYLLGVVHMQQGTLEDAERLIGKALKINPRFLDGLRHRGEALQRLNRHREAIACFDQALAVKPDSAELALARGVSLSLLERHAEALKAYDRALSTKPDLAIAWSMRGNALFDLQRHQDAVASYDRAVGLNSAYAEAWRYRGLALVQLDRVEEALASFDRALRVRPDDADTWEQRGNLLMRIHAHADAVGAYDRVLGLNPRSLYALYNRGNARSILGHYKEAIADCERVLASDPDYPYALGVLIHCRLQTCDWKNLESERSRIRAALDAGKRAVSPLNHKAITDSAGEQLLCAEVWVRNELPQSVAVWRGGRYRHDRIRVAYVSADLNNSAITSLMAGVFEGHDRKRFETIAVSFGPDVKTPMRTRLEAAFERFVEARLWTEARIADKLNEMEVDIAVDLMGYTGLSRTRIFTSRPAPIQVNYLGFPGTLGADWIDYIIADRTVIPDRLRGAYSEKIAYLPDCFMPADRSREIAINTPTRTDAGLPESGFVFASFNNASKFSPEMFDVWMRLLSQIEGSVLWLPSHHAIALRNLKAEAERRGVASSRLVFASFAPTSEGHLARLRCADLCLDTLPYNAHTTASDALWAGLPVLTSAGEGFGGRVAASLLNAAGLPELVTHSLAEYEAAALALARTPETLAGLKSRLERNRDTCALFDTPRFTRNLEAAFTAMWERHQEGKPPADFAVEGAFLE